MKVVHEEFPSLFAMTKALQTRKNNSAMEGENSSSTGSSGFTGTKSLKESYELLRNGWNEPVSEIKKSIRQNLKGGRDYCNVPKPMPRNCIVGYIPNVPNAIQGIPESMINKEMVIQKRKTISINYIESGSCGESRDFFERAGAALVTAITAVEKYGIQVKLSLGFFCGKTSNTLAVGSVMIKNYGERFDIQKICFPMIHTSMFRRIGFKWLETVPELTDGGFSCGYGRPEGDIKELSKLLECNDKDYVLTPTWINNHNCNVKEILEYLGFKSKK